MIKSIGESNRTVYFCHGRETEEELCKILRCYQSDELFRHVTLVHFSASSEEAVGRVPLGSKVESNREDELFQNTRKARAFFPDFVVDLLTVSMQEDAIDDDYYYPDPTVSASLDCLDGNGNEVSMATLGPPASLTRKKVNTLTKHGVLWVCEKLKLPTSALSMGPPGKDCPKMKDLLGVRILASG